MDIQFAILGLLSWQPLSGYDLKKMIAESDILYWSGNNNQIYNNLIALHKAGLVSQEVVFQESLPAKKIYTLTEAGRQRLRTQLLSDPELPELRSNFMIQLAWAGKLSKDQLEDLLARYGQEIRIQLHMRKERANPLTVQPGQTARESFLLLKLQEHLISFYQYELDWIRQLQKELSEQSE
jgi:PadR family transcriptional regulator AphA